MRLWLKTFLTLAIVSLAGYVLDSLLRYEGITRRDLLRLSDILVGLVAAILTFMIAKHQEERSSFVAVRLKVIAEMNHHIRNALQVIAFQAHSGTNKEIAAMQQAVGRITWALSEVLPQLPGFDDTPDLTSRPKQMGTAAGQGEKTGTALN